MVSNKYPCGVLRYCVGDITIIDHDNIYWVADCDVSTKHKFFAYPNPPMLKKVKVSHAYPNPNILGKG